MITEDAIVISIENDETWIETQRKSACGHCSASAGCGTSVLSKVIGNKHSRMRAINKVDAKVGDRVVIGLNEGALLKGAYMTYLLPLLYLIAFAIFGDMLLTRLQMQGSELLVIIFAAAGFYLGLKHLKRFSQSISNNESYQPVILNKAGISSVFVKL
jgi:sigma-E factor negative regulatory protein RseC